MGLLGFVIGFLLFGFRPIRGALILLIACSVLGTGWTIAALVAGFCAAFVPALLADPAEPGEARG